MRGSRCKWGFYNRHKRTRKARAAVSGRSHDSNSNLTITAIERVPAKRCERARGSQTRCVCGDKARTRRIVAVARMRLDESDVSDYIRTLLCNNEDNGFTLKYCIREITDIFFLIRSYQFFSLSPSLLWYVYINFDRQFSFITVFTDEHRI